MAMWVDPAVRGSGSADALVEAVMAWAQSEGAGVVRLEVIKSNARARRFYERNSFSLTGHEAVRQIDGRTEVRMERQVKAE